MTYSPQINLKIWPSLWVSGKDCIEAVIIYIYILVNVISRITGSPVT